MIWPFIFGVINWVLQEMEVGKQKSIIGSKFFI